MFMLATLIIHGSECVTCQGFPCEKKCLIVLKAYFFVLRIIKESRNGWIKVRGHKSKTMGISK